MSLLRDNAMRMVAAMQEAVVQYVITESETQMPQLGRNAIAMQTYLKLRAANFDHDSAVNWIDNYFNDEISTAVAQAAQTLELTHSFDKGSEPSEQQQQQREG